MQKGLGDHEIDGIVDVLRALAGHDDRAGFADKQGLRFRFQKASTKEVNCAVELVRRRQLLSGQPRYGARNKWFGNAFLDLPGAVRIQFGFFEGSNRIEAFPKCKIKARADILCGAKRTGRLEQQTPFEALPFCGKSLDQIQESSDDQGVIGSQMRRPMVDLGAILPGDRRDRLVVC